MPTYNYKARDKMGKLLSGTMAAESKSELVNKLSAMGHMTTQVSESRAASKGESILERFQQISTQDMIMFYVQFSNMINAGVPLLNSLNILGGQTENKKLKETIGSVARGVEAGDSLSQSLEKHSQVFPNLFIQLAKAGEASGKLDVLIAKYGQYFEQELELRQKVQGALFYPVVLFTCGIGVILFLVTFILPQFTQMFLQADVKLPIITTLMVGLGTMIKSTWYLWVIFFIGIRYGIRYYANTEKGKYNLDKIKSKIPVLGSIITKSAISRFTRTFGILIASGVPIMQALDMTKDVVENAILSRVIMNIRDAVEKGSRISDYLTTSGGLPIDTIQMISVGEETGNLEGMLEKVADFYDSSVGYTIKKLTTVIEPLFLIIMGGMVGLIMASMLIPMFSMVDVMNP